MESWQVGVAAVALFVAFMLQGAVGFGAGLIVVPIMLWARIELPEAVSILLMNVAAHAAWGTWRLREIIPWRATGAIAVMRAFAAPLGLWAMVSLDTEGLTLTKQVVGGAILAIVLVQWFARVKPRQRIDPLWAPVASAASGAMAAGIGMGGPPVVLWTMAHDWPAQKSRAFLWSLFLSWVPVHVPILLWWYGQRVIEPMILGLIATPIGVVGGLLGERIGQRLNRHRLRIAAYLVLIAIAAGSIVSAFFG